MSSKRPVPRRTTRLALALASVLVLVIVFAGVVSALTAGNVDGVWGDPPGTNPQEFRWCYAPDNTGAPAGDPTSCSTSNAGIQNGPNSTLTDENQVRYGDPAVGSGSANRSGFGFNGNNSVGVVAADTPFYLGRFTHYNRPIYADPVLTDISIDVTVGGILCDDNSVPAEGSTQTFTYDVTLEETNNNPDNWPNDTCPYGETVPYNNPYGGCNDRVTISQVPDTEFTCPEGVRTVQILGFIPGAGCHLTYNPPTSSAFVTAESSQNEACLWARISDPTTPLAVTLASFEATGQTDRVMITWETVSELQNAGFNLYRSANNYQVGERVNAELIPSQAPGSAQGSAYQF
ncbi:MAG: choice-of-anchor K domain-containing protein, partial [Anaerolineae bacterium]|nr:choice-of-anchor K domain-containing protein [Anaerolineae bacterium]